MTVCKSLRRRRHSQTETRHVKNPPGSQPGGLVREGASGQVPLVQVHIGPTEGEERTWTGQTRNGACLISSKVKACGPFHNFIVLWQT